MAITKDIQDVATALREQLPSICDEWNTVSLPLMETLYRKSFKKIFENRQTQEKTKNVSPILDKVTERFLRKRLDNFFVTHQEFLQLNLAMLYCPTFLGHLL